MPFLLVGLASSNLGSPACEKVSTTIAPTTHHTMPCTRIPYLFHPAPGICASRTQARHKHSCYFHTPSQCITSPTATEATALPPESPSYPLPGSLFRVLMCFQDYLHIRRFGGAGANVLWCLSAPLAHSSRCISLPRPSGVPHAVDSLTAGRFLGYAKRACTLAFLRISHVFVFMAVQP